VECVNMTPLVGRLLLLATWVGALLLPGIHGAVTGLNDGNFYEYAKDKDVLLVDFYAPWCPDCKNLDPDFEAAARSLAGRRSTDLAKVDCFGAGKGLCSTYGVKRWPTLKNFNRGQYTGDYEGGLSAGEIAGYVNTVENSAGPVSNPYAAPYTPMVVATQQCMSRCKISKAPNKTPCFARCKGAKSATGKVLPQPVINEKSCAKCRQPQIAGKFKNGKKRSLHITDSLSKRSFRGMSETNKVIQGNRKASLAEKKSQTEILEVIHDRLHDKKIHPSPTALFMKELFSKTMPRQANSSNQTSVVEVIGATKSRLGVRDIAFQGLKEHETRIPGELAYNNNYKRTIRTHSNEKNNQNN